MSVVEFSADAWQASSPGLAQGLARRVEAVDQLAQGLQALAASDQIKGEGADAMRAYIAEVHGPILQCLLLGLSTFQTAVGVYWAGYAQVDSGGNFRLVKDELDAHASRLGAGAGTVRGWAGELRTIAGDASHLVSLGGAGATAADRLGEELDRMHATVKGLVDAWQGFEGSDHGFGQVKALIGELGRIVTMVGGLSVGRGRSYRPGSFGPSLAGLEGLTAGMVEYCQANQDAAAKGWKTAFDGFQKDLEALEKARREQAGWDLIWDGLQIIAGAVVTVVGLGLTPFTGGFSLALTGLGGAMVVGGINNGINHYSIATTGKEFNLAGMAAEWLDANVARPVAGWGGGWQFAGGVLSGAGHALTGMAQFSVKDTATGVSALITDQAARDALWQQLADTGAQIISGNWYKAGQVTGELAGLLIPGAVAAKTARAAGIAGKAGEAASGLAMPARYLPGSGMGVKPLSSPGPVTITVEKIRDRAPRAFAIADEVLSRAGRRLDPVAPDRLPVEIREQILSTEKGKRPDPSTYLSPEYIRQHLEQFDDGATRFMTQTNLDKYGVGQRDGTAFVMPKSQVDALVTQTGGDPRLMEQALGLPEGFFDNGAVRVDIPLSGSEGLRIPSGNEAGASDQWIPGGNLPTGISEAVIDVGGLDSARYSLSTLSQMEGAK